MKRSILAALLLGLLILLCGCSQSQTGTSLEQADSALPTATVSVSPPTGDEGLATVKQVAFYVPGDDGRTLTREINEVRLSGDRIEAYDIAQALLTRLGSSFGVSLSLYGQRPVLVSNGVCTVNLSSSALVLDNEQLYRLFLCVSSTLCARSGINAVGFLITDQAPAMDITGNLPLGLLTGHGGDDMGALWSTFSARRAPLGTDASTVALTASANLYFPLKDGSGTACESRSITFEGQSAQQLCAGLTEALSAGSLYVDSACDMPDLTALMTAMPRVTDLTEGGKLLSLSFVSDLDALLSQQGIDEEAFLSSVILTMTSFVPNITAISVRIGEEAADFLPNTGGYVRRSSLDSTVMDQAIIYLSADGTLFSVTRMLPADRSSSPRLLLNALISGPRQSEKEQGISLVLPYSVSESDVLGLSVENDTLVINLSEFFASAVENAEQLDEQLICYSMVNTLCEALGLRRVVFFFGGQQRETLGGKLSWSGEFLYAPGLAGEDRG